MKKVFISHSSKDKDFFVKPLVDNLKKSKSIGEDRIVYDELTFESGAKIIEEIRRTIDMTDLFIILLSKNSLSSEWVKQEILWAKDLDSNFLDEQRIMPVIIDDINKDNQEIPEWLKKYNLRNVKSPSKLSRMIFSRVTEISWKNSEFLKKKTNLFVGRNSEMESFESRINDFTIEKTNFVIASGMSTVGRRSFLKRALNKTGIVRDSYSPPIIVLDGHQSIEDFIKELSNVTDLDVDIDLMSCTLDKKIDLAFDLLYALNTDLKDKLFIDDQGAIVTHTGELAYWFKQIVEKFASTEYVNISACIMSKYKPHFIYSLKNVFHLHIDVLSPSDRNKLLFQYSNLNDLILDKPELAAISQLFSGFPEEIFYTIDVIKENSKEYFYKNTHIISDYSDNKIQSIISGFNYTDNDNKVLKILSKFNFINLESLSKILEYASIPEKINNIDKYMRHGMVNKIGVDGEYITLNLAAKNYYERQIHLEKQLSNALDRFVAYIDINESNLDIADEMFVMQEKLKLGEKVPLAKLIPSYYLKTMKNLYDNRKNSAVIKLADSILQSSDVLDSYIRDEIRFFLCSSLARLKDERFKYEVQSISGYKHNFLFGFYYRQIGRFDLAIERFNKVLEENRTYSQAKRELVLLYNKIGEYDKAYLMAKDNYENNRNNPYHIQAYFQSVLYQREDSQPLLEKKRILGTLLSDFEKIDSPSARNMFLICKAKYNMEIEKDYSQVQSILDQASEEFPEDDTYILLFQVDFFERTKDLHQLEKVLELMKNSNFNRKNSNYYNDFLKCQIYINALKNNEIEWKENLSKLTLSDSAKSIINERAEKLMNN